MSEKDNANESGEMHGNSPSFNRRRFVKALGIAGGVTAFGSFGAGNVAAKGDGPSEKGPTVTDATIVNASSTTNVQATLEPKENQSLENHFNAELGLSPQRSNTLVVSLETNDAQWNEDNPALVMVPFKPASQAQGAGGLLSTLVVHHDGDTLPVASLGVTAETNVSTTTSSLQASGIQTMTLYGTDKQGKVLQLDQTTRPSSGASSTEISPNGLFGSIGCTTCEGIVGYLCYGGAGEISIAECFAACLPAVETGPGYLLCSAACGVIVRGLAVVGCTGTSNYICKGLGYC